MKLYRLAYYKDKIDMLITKYPGTLLKIHKHYVRIQGPERVLQIFYNGVVHYGKKKFKWSDGKIKRIMQKKVDTL